MIKICLEEIDRCRPYFVGSLGFRYGWALSANYRDELLEKTFEIGEAAFPWLRNFRDKRYLLFVSLALFLCLSLSIRSVSIVAHISWSLTVCIVLCSVTEGEMLHGALNDPSLNPRTFFYFRSLSLSLSLS